MHPFDAVEHNFRLNRRQFFRQNAMGLGGIALGSLLGKSLASQAQAAGLPGAQHFPAKAKRCIYLSMIGAPSQFETFDPKPELEKRFNEDLPASIRNGQRITGMTSGQARFPVAPSVFGFKQYGKGGTWVSDLLPFTAKMADDICVIKTMNTEAINHEPANMLSYTGNMVPGKASLGSWLSYGLGSMNEDLPTFVVLHARHSNPGSNVQAISARLWSAGFLPTQYSGVTFRSAGDPVLYLRDPDGVSRETRRKMLDGLNELNELTYQQVGDPETATRLKQYEMAFRMQASVPELADLSKETKETFDLYGPDSRDRGTFANSCLTARRLVERGVRFVQIFHRGWDQHGNLPNDIKAQCKDVDQAAWALIQDLKRRGMLDDTLVVWGGEFGRTPFGQNQQGQGYKGRDHFGKAYSWWLAGGGIKKGHVYGETDEFGWNITKDSMHVHDMQATLMHLFGINHEALTYRYQGRQFRLTDVHGKVAKGILA
jgi:hypothetical protein